MNNQYYDYSVRVVEPAVVEGFNNKYYNNGTSYQNKDQRPPHIRGRQRGAGKRLGKDQERKQERSVHCA